MVLSVAVTGPLLGSAPAVATPRPPAVTPAMFEMLGMADEYISRFDYWSGKPRPAFVEHFYPHESSLARTYERLIAAHEKESGTKVSISRKTPQGHIELYSSKLAAAINAHYVMVNKTIATLDHRLLDRASRANRLRYLKGAYARYGVDGTNLIRMANAGYKIETIARALRQLGCKQVSVQVVEAIPTTNQVHFVPPAGLALALGIKKLVPRPQAKPLPIRKRR